MNMAKHAHHNVRVSLIFIHHALLEQAGVVQHPILWRYFKVMRMSF
jgi:hypothetical protein